jgi:DNA-directed RNA polymerase I subunit RPA2
MIRKLYSLVSGSIVEDNPDTMMNQDILLPGHMYTMFVKEKFQDWLGNIRSVLEKQLKSTSKLPDGKYQVPISQHAITQFLISEII